MPSEDGDGKAAGADTGSETAGHLTPPSPQPTHRPDRSCITCHRRKIRCNKQSPCQGCLRAGIPCEYPSTGQVKRRVRKATIADVASRISDLERTIVSANKDSSFPKTSLTSEIPFRSPHSSPSDPQDHLIQYDRHGQGLDIHSQEVLVRNGSSSQFFNEALISQVIEEDIDKSSLLNSAANSAVQDAQSPFNLMGIISNPASFPPSTGWQLSRRHATQLWGIFVATVDPSIKVLHIPTAEVSVFTAIENPKAATKDVLSLASAVFFAAVVSLGSEEVKSTLGVSQDIALRHLKKRFHQSLAEADMLESPTVTLLQGLAIYLTSIRAHNYGRGIWILNGLAVRMAHSIGLHRDGSKLGFSPFESEVRRRLWWHLIARDARAAEDHGISAWPGLPGCDTKMPLNVDDGALTVDMEELPTSQRGWTRMSLPKVCMEVSQMVHEVNNLSRAPASNESKETIRARMFENLRARLQQYLDLSNSVIPLQRITMQIALLIFYKADFVSRQQFANLESPEKRESFATEENLATVCKYMEIHLSLWTDELMSPYRWFMNGHPQYHILLYILWHLCVRPEGPNVKRAWQVVDGAFEVERHRFEEAFSAPALKSVVLHRLRRKAELVRDSLSSDTTTESRDAGLSEDVAGSASASASTSSNPTESESVDWNNFMQNMPDWNTLVGDLQMDMGDFSNSNYI